MGQAIKEAGTDTLRGNQIQLGIDSSEHPAALSDLAPPISGEIAERLQDQADLVEVVGDGIAARVDAGLQPRGLSLESQRSFRPPRMGLALGATVARVMLQYRPALINLLLDLRINARRPMALRIKIDLPESGPQSRGQIAPGGGIFGVEVLADLHTSGYRRRCGKVGDCQPTHVAFLG